MSATISTVSRSSATADRDTTVNVVLYFETKDTCVNKCTVFTIRISPLHLKIHGHSLFQRIFSIPNYNFNPFGQTDGSPSIVELERTVIMATFGENNQWFAHQSEVIFKVRHHTQAKKNVLLCREVAAICQINRPKKVFPQRNCQWSTDFFLQIAAFNVALTSYIYRTDKKVWCHFQSFGLHPSAKV